MEDTDLKDHYSKLLGSVAHFKIVNNNLVITLDFDSGGFAEWKYLDLILGKDKTKQLMEENKGKTFTDIVREKYMARYEEIKSG